MQKELSDDELISRIKETGDTYYNQLVKKYQNKFEIILCNVSKRLNISRYSKDDFLLTFYVCFQTCLTKYKEQKASFLRFFNIVAERRITREFLQQINSPDALTNAVSLDEQVADGITRLELIANEDENVEDQYSYEQMKFTLRSATKNVQKPRIYRIIARILWLKSQGFTIKEISKKLSINEQKVRRLMKNKKGEELKNEILRFK